MLKKRKVISIPVMLMKTEYCDWCTYYILAMNYTKIRKTTL